MRLLHGLAVGLVFSMSWPSTVRAGADIYGLELPGGKVHVHRHLTSESRPFAFVLIADDRHFVWAECESEDWRVVRREAQRSDDDLFLFRIRDRHWIVRDPQIIAETGKKLRSRGELDRTESRLSDQEARLGDERARLGDEQTRIGDRLTEIADRRAELRERRSEGTISRETLAAREAKLDGEEQRLISQRSEIARRLRDVASRREQVVDARNRHRLESERWTAEQNEAIEKMAHAIVRDGRARRVD